MQELTPKICAEANAGTHEQLRDMRDEQEYWVIKLKNGHCWMAQDLRLTLTNEGLTSELSDINESKLGNYDIEETSDGDVIYKWNENSYYPPRDTFYVEEGEKFVNTSSNFQYVYSYDFGEYIMNDLHGVIQGCASNSYGPAACPDHATPIAGNWKPTLDYATTGQHSEMENMMHIIKLGYTTLLLQRRRGVIGAVLAGEA